MFNNMIQHFHTDAYGIAIMGSFFFYGYAGMQIPAGAIIDRWGTRYPLFAALAGCGISVFLFGHCHTFITATVMRFIIGLFSAFSFISALTLIKRYLPANYFTTAIASLQCLGALGSLCGQAPLAMLNGHLGWQNSLLLLSVLFVACGVALLTLQPQSSTSSSSSTRRYAEFFQTLKTQRCWLLIGCSAISWAPVGVIGALWGLPFFIKHFHTSNIQASQMMVYFWIGLACAPLIGWINDRYRCTLRLLFSLFMLAAISMIIIINTPSIVLTQGCLFMLGLSCASQLLSFSIAQSTFPPNVFASLSSVINMSAIIGAGLSQFLIASLLNWIQPGSHTNTQDYFLQTYQWALYLLPTLAVIGFLSTVRIKSIVQKSSA